MQCIQKVQSVDKKRKKHSVRAAQHFQPPFMLFTTPNTHYIFYCIRQVQFDFTKFASYMLTEALDAIFDAILINTKNDICQHIIGTSFAIGPTIAINTTESKTTTL